MKFLLIASLVTFSLSSFADWNKMKGKPLEEQKQMLNSKVDRKLEALHSSKTCISEAKDEKTLRDCMKNKRQAMEDVKDDWKMQKDETKGNKSEN